MPSWCHYCVFRWGFGLMDTMHPCPICLLPLNLQFRASVHFCGPQDPWMPSPAMPWAIQGGPENNREQPQCLIHSTESLHLTWAVPVVSLPYRFQKGCYFFYAVGNMLNSPKNALHIILLYIKGKTARADKQEYRDMNLFPVVLMCMLILGTSVNYKTGRGTISPKGWRRHKLQM